MYSSEWSSQAELKAVIVAHYRALDANMNADRWALFCITNEKGVA